MARTRNERRRARVVQVLTGGIILGSGLLGIKLVATISLPAIIVIGLGLYLILTRRLFVKGW